MDLRDEALWERADAILDRLLDIPDTRRLDELAALRLPKELDACVRRLLGAHAGHGVLDGELAAPQVPELEGRRFGGWVLDRELGRGGMSVVWLAHRVEEAHRQRAALKLLTVGALGRHGLDRFRREQAILARLNHPHIAHLYETGVAEDGTPWLAMELVEGERIDAWCEHRALGLAQRLRLALDVCAAIAYAHRSLVVHADLKPSNVLVDAEGHVRVVDFGIGRLLDGHFERTGTLARALTPEYAAPEQTLGDPATTATDVFGLGALLYCMLAGCAPRKLRADADIVAPSQTARESSGRPEDPRGAYARQLRGDLDTILLTALATRPERRYPSVDALAADLRAWLARRPIAARPPGRWYQSRKFILRNRLAVSATMVVALAIFGGTAAALWQARRADAEAVAAHLQAQRATAIKDFLLRLLQRTDPGRVSGDPPASELLRHGVQDISANRSLPVAVRADLLREIGISQRARGRQGEARATLDAALALYADGALDDPEGYARTLDSRAWVAYELGDVDGAIARFRQADALLGGAAVALTSAHEHVRAGLAELLATIGHTTEAVAIARDLVARMRTAGRTQETDYGRTLRVLGMAADMDHHPLEAIGWLQQAAQALDPVEDAPSLATVHNELGLASWHAGQLTRAEHEFDAALRGYSAVYGSDHWRSVIVQRHLASVHLAQGKTDRAIAELKEVVRQEKARHGDSPHRNVALAEHWLALAYYRDGRTMDALAPAQSAWQMSLRLAPQFRARHDTLAPLVGLLHFELQQNANVSLLQQGSGDCAAPEPPFALRRWFCIARALRQADQGRCVLPTIDPPPAVSNDDIDRRWWAALHLLRAQCGDPRNRAAELLAANTLANHSQPAVPEWLHDRLAAANHQ